MSGLLLFVPNEGLAQGVDSLAGGPGTIVGVTIDVSGAPVEGVEILIGGLERRVRSGPNGAFRFADVAEGEYELRARRIGFEAQSPRVVVGPEGGRVLIVMRPGTPVLERIVTSADRGGLSGVVSDTSFRPLSGVQVRILGGGGQWTRTDSAGSFFVAIRRGSYMVQFSAEGRDTRLLSVEVPADSGRWLAVMLGEGDGPSVRERIALRELRYRLAWRQGVMTSFFTREDLARWGALPLTNVVRMAAMRPFDSVCHAFVNGGPERAPIWRFDADEMESVEVYPVRWGGRPDPMMPEANCPEVYVWLRR